MFTLQGSCQGITVTQVALLAEILQALQCPSLCSQCAQRVVAAFVATVTDRVLQTRQLLVLQRLDNSQLAPSAAILVQVLQYVQVAMARRRATRTVVPGTSVLMCVD